MIWFYDRIMSGFGRVCFVFVVLAMLVGGSLTRR
jgi:hypothetical protein